MIIAGRSPSAVTTLAARITVVASITADLTSGRHNRRTGTLS
jgi:hypothetical protein